MVQHCRPGLPGAGTNVGSVCTIGPARAANQTSPASICPVENNLVNFGQNTTYATGVAPGYGAQTPTTTLYQRNGSIERASLNLSGQWRPIDSLEIFMEGFYTRKRQEAPTDVDVLLQYVCPDPAQDTVYSGTNIVSKSVSSCYNLTSDQDSRSKEDTFQGATGITWNLSDHFMVKSEFDATLSNAFSTNYIPDDTFNIPTDGLQLIDNYNGTGAHYITQVGNPQKNAAGEYLDQFFDQRTQSRGSEWDWRIDGTYTFAPSSFIQSVEFGFRAADRSAHNNGATGEGLNCITQPNTGLFYNNYTLAANSSTICAGSGTQLGYANGGSGGHGGANAQAIAANFTNIGGYALTSLPAGAYSSTHGSWFGGKFGVNGWVNVDPDLALLQQCRNHPVLVRLWHGQLGFDHLRPARFSGEPLHRQRSQQSGLCQVQLQHPGLRHAPGRQCRFPLHRHDADGTGEQFDCVPGGRNQPGGFELHTDRGGA